MEAMLRYEDPFGYEEETPDPKVIEEASKFGRALIQSFLQTLKSFRLYDPNHPILSKFLEKLKKDFDKFLEKYGSFPLLAGESKLFYYGQVVYENKNIKESLAYYFFKDGIREIRFERGLGFEELIDFLSVIRKSDLVNRLGDDLVTLLWEKDFPHITFGIVDEFIEEGAEFIPATREDVEKDLEYRGVRHYRARGIVEETEKEYLSEPEGKNLRQALNLTPDQSLVMACQLSPEELEEINLEVQQEQRSDYVFVLIENLIEILLHLGDDLEAYENMITRFNGIIASLIDQKKIRETVEISNKLQATLESIALKDKQIYAIRRVLGTLSQPHSIERLGEAMRGNGEVKAADLMQYFSFLTKEAIDPLCNLLNDLESGRWAKEIIEVLARLSGDDIQPFVPYLSHPNPIFVYQILCVLEKVGPPSSLDYLGNLVGHEDPKVREMTLRIFKKFGERGKKSILRFLKDPLPDIRSKASLIYSRAAREEAVKPLTEIILSDDFHKRDYEEKASFIRALGESGAQEAIPVLKKIAKERRWFHRKNWDEMRICAANTLRMIGAVEHGGNPGNE